MSTSRLIIYDTTNFTDFPIGGQLTSVRNFLRYLVEFRKDRIRDILLVGVTKDPQEVGRLIQAECFGAALSFLPVACVETDLGHTAHSLRLAFAKGLLRYGKTLQITKRDCNYIQTPEAVGPVRLLKPGAKYVIFSHGSYANMDRGFRFFRKNLLVRKAFGLYLKYVIRHASLILCLDEDSMRDYRPYTDRLVMAENSIVLPSGYADWKPHPFSGKLLFVGRLSKDKGVDGIIRAVQEAAAGAEGPSGTGEALSLTVVGEGEEGENLRAMADGGNVVFTGAVPPAEVSRYMEASDILVMNSAFEGVPMSILEALAHGLPVVTTNVGGIGKTVQFGKDAEETDGSPQSILQAVRTIEGSYERYAEEAHLAGADHSYEKIGGKIYEQLSRFRDGENCGNA